MSDMSCYFCSGDYPLHSNPSDIRFMEELFPDFSLESDNLCVSCLRRFDNLIEYANSDFTPAAAHLTSPQTQDVPQEIQESLQIQPQLEQKHMIEASFTMRKISLEELHQIKNAKERSLKRKRRGSKASVLSRLDNYPPMHIIKVNEGNLQDAIRRVLQQTLISKFSTKKYV